MPQEYLLTFKPFNEAGPEDTTFLIYEPDKAIPSLIKSNAKRVYVKHIVYDTVEALGVPEIKPELIPSLNPKLDFIKAFTEAEEADPKITHNNDVLRGRVELGQNNMIADNVVITHTTIGNDCIIYPNCTLGFPALAMERDLDNKLHDFKHIGRLEIGNNVRIGQLTNIARGTLANTIVEDNVRTDAHVNVAHNCHIKKGAVLAVGCVLGGSVTIGEDSWIGLNATLREHVTVGHNALVGMGAVVLDDVKDNDIVAGCPAESIKHKVTLSDAARFMMAGYQLRGQY